MNSALATAAAAVLVVALFRLVSFGLAPSLLHACVSGGTARVREAAPKLVHVTGVAVVGGEVEEDKELTCPAAGLEVRDACAVR